MYLLPSEVITPRLTLRQWRPDDVLVMRAAIEASLEHLRPWLAWAEFEPVGDDDRSQLIAAWLDEWRNGGDAVYGAFVDDAVIGGCGLHRRIGPNGVEIGYWIHAHHVRQGYATELTRGLTTAAFDVDGIERVEIHHDKANVASAGIPRTLGFERGAERQDEIVAPGEIGIDCTWSVTTSAWPTR